MRRRVLVTILPLAVTLLVVAGCGIPGPIATSTKVPLPTPTISAFAGRWDSTDMDQSHQTLAIADSSPGSGILDVSYTDDSATVCGGRPASASGTGTATAVKLVVTLTAYCLNPKTLWGDAPYTFNYDKPTDTLTDSYSVVWHRKP
jgi:hypothetical protein